MGCRPFQVILFAHSSIVSPSTNFVPFQCHSRMPQQRSMGFYFLWEGGEYSRGIGLPMPSHNATLRCTHGVRLPLLSGPFSIVLCSLAMATCSASSNAA